MKWNPSPRDDQTAIVTMHPVYNPDSVKFLSRTIDEVAASGKIRSMIFTSEHEKNWCIGMDIPWIMEQYKKKNRDTLKALFDDVTNVCRKILTMPAVTISAINGHAFGAGVVFACMCDIRFMKSDRGYFCLNEADLDLTDAFTPSALVLFKEKFDPFIIDVMIPTAKRVTAPELEKHGIIERACADNDDVMRAAQARAREFSARGELFNKFIEEKLERNKPVLETIETKDPGAFDHIVGRFFALMDRMQGTASGPAK